MALETESPVVFDESDAQAFERSVFEHMQTTSDNAGSSLGEAIAAIIAPVVSQAVSAAIGAVKANDMRGNIDALIVQACAATDASNDAQAKLLASLTQLIASCDFGGVSIVLTSVYAYSSSTTVYLTVGTDNMSITQNHMTAASLCKAIKEKADKHKAATATDKEVTKSDDIPF